MGIFKGKFFAGESRWILLKGLFIKSSRDLFFFPFVRVNKQQVSILLVTMFKYVFQTFCESGKKN